MKVFDVYINDSVQYGQIEAKTKEEAIIIALEWWIERHPNIIVEEREVDENVKMVR